MAVGGVALQTVVVVVMVRVNGEIAAAAGAK